MAQQPPDCVSSSELHASETCFPPSTDSRQSLFSVSLDGQPAASLPAARLAAIAPVSLAYIGDAVFELYVRSCLLEPPKRIRHYHQQVVARVKAEQQAYYADVLTPHLTDTEKDVLRRGRNATTGRHRRSSARDYQKATGFEALIGFLYLSDRSRMLALLNRLEISNQEVSD